MRGQHLEPVTGLCLIPFLQPIDHVAGGAHQAEPADRHLLVELADSTASGVLCGLVAEGMGIALVDPFTAMGPIQPGLRTRFLPEIEYRVALVFPSAVTRSRPTARFAAMVLADATMPAL
jgi:hypothetical protein